MAIFEMRPINQFLGSATGGSISLVLLAFLLSSSANTSFSQLRTGSASRTLYQREVRVIQLSDIDDSSDGTETSMAQKRSVVAASHTRNSSKQNQTSRYVRSASMDPPKTNAANYSAEEESMQDVDRLEQSQRKSHSNSSTIQLTGCKSCGQSSSMLSTVGRSVIDTPSVMAEATEMEIDEGITNHDIRAYSTDCDTGCGNSCYSDCCDPGACSPLAGLLSRMSIRGEAPLFWRRGQSTPPLVTSDSPTAANGTDIPGSLASPDVRVLRGGVYDNDVRVGGRLSLWLWTDDTRQSALAFRYWNAGTISNGSTFRSDDFATQVLGRPFFDSSAATNAQEVLTIGDPGALIGNIRIDTKSQLYGLNIERECMFYADRFTQLFWLYGYNQFALNESLLIGSTTTDIDAASPTVGHTFTVSDTFRTRNRMDGFSFGLRSKRDIAAFKLDTWFRLTAGNLQRRILIQGSSSDTDQIGATTTDNQGLLARTTNARNIKDNTFVLSPEVGINLGYAIGPNLDFSIGYNYLMVPKVAQASRQIDPSLRVNTSNPLAGSQDPAFDFNTGRYWVRALGLGAQYRY